MSGSESFVSQPGKKITICLSLITVPSFDPLVVDSEAKTRLLAVRSAKGGNLRFRKDRSALQ